MYPSQAKLRTCACVPVSYCGSLLYDCVDMEGVVVPSKRMVRRQLPISPPLSTWVPGMKLKLSGFCRNTYPYLLPHCSTLDLRLTPLLSCLSGKPWGLCLCLPSSSIMAQLTRDASLDPLAWGAIIPKDHSNFVQWREVPKRSQDKLQFCLPCCFQGLQAGATCLHPLSCICWLLRKTFISLSFA